MLGHIDLKDHRKGTYPRDVEGLRQRYTFFSTHWSNTFVKIELLKLFYFIQSRQAILKYWKIVFVCLVYGDSLSQ